VNTTAKSFAMIALAPEPEVLRGGVAPCGATCRLDGAEKISKDMKMTKMPRIDAR